MSVKECKRCLLREAAEEDTFRDIQGQIGKLSAEEKTDEACYHQRLEACKACEHLISGVCLNCGCYVEFRAAFQKMKCPNVKDRKW